MNIDFYKLHVNRNDFILIDLRKQEVPTDNILSELSAAVCKRRTGVGAENVIFITDGQLEELSIRVFTLEGLETNIIDDALVAVGRFAFDSGLMGKKPLIIHNNGVDRAVEAIDSQNCRIDTGEPYKDCEHSHVITDNIDSNLNITVEVEDRNQSMTPVSFSHECVVMYNANLNQAERKSIASKVDQIYNENIWAIPVFIDVYGREELRITIYHGKNAQSLICCAAAGVTGVINGFTDNEIIIKGAFSPVFFQWNQETNHVLVTASANYIFSGSWYFESGLEAAGGV